MNRIFVYGTLQRGCKNHHHLAGQTFVAKARTAAGYRLYHLGDYPGMVQDATDTEGVIGELWDVDASALDHLDAFEGISEGLYRRAPVPILPPFDQGRVDAYLYARTVAGFPVHGPVWQE